MAIFKRIKPDDLDPHKVQVRHTVLLVDDEADNLHLLRAILTTRYEVLTAPSAEQALHIVQGLPEHTQLALVVTDQRMPGMSGVQLCEKLSQITPDTLRIIVTGYIDVDAIVDSVNRANIYRFIIKPFERQDFELTVQRAIETWRGRQQHKAHVQNLERELVQCRHNMEA